MAVKGSSPCSRLCGSDARAQAVAKIEELFPENIERRKVAFTLMHWPKKPTTKEQETPASSIDRSRNVAYKVMNKLMKAGLFSSELGSTPLYRYNERIRLNASKGLEMSKINDTYKTFKGIKGDTEDSEPLEKDPKEEGITNKTVIETPPIQVDTPIGPALEKHLALQEAELKGLRSTIVQIKEMISNLSLGDSKEDSNTNPPTAPIEFVESSPSPTVRNSEFVKDLIERTIVETLNKMQTDNPVAQALETEVAAADVTDPSMDLETENPLEDAVDSVSARDGGTSGGFLPH